MHAIKSSRPIVGRRICRWLNSMIPATCRLVIRWRRSYLLSAGWGGSVCCCRKVWFRETVSHSTKSVPVFRKMRIKFPCACGGCVGFRWTFPNPCPWSVGSVCGNQGQGKTDFHAILLRNSAQMTAVATATFRLSEVGLPAG